ncbi:hypothetical protein SPF06_06855 [Sinomonas sp. JGH33]|uniref:Uncharacterized protein n=1 Tax=Sinomonas terricola TaxID=3110330 RepID=A0ABU5T4N0_9MICC|nr:hypothetical protein [Sinomonas sp. JGH33]MEA5454436.1 hypothetical protein [Sinomonas sp. JGH33]
MPWWFWILLWAVLLVGTAAAAVGGGFWLVRKALRVVRDAGGVLTRLPGPSVMDSAAQGDGDGASAPGSAVFADPDEMRREYERGKAERRTARIARRVARRAQRGQAQSLRDLGLI